MLERTGGLSALWAGIRRAGDDRAWALVKTFWSGLVANGPAQERVLPYVDCPACAAAALHLVVFALLILSSASSASSRCLRTFFPTSTFPVITVVWGYSGLSAQEMSTRIIYNAERSMTTTVNDIDHIESQSLNGVGIIKSSFIRT